MKKQPLFLHVILHVTSKDFVVSPSVVRIPSQLHVTVWKHSEHETNMVCSRTFSKMVDELKCCKYSKVFMLTATRQTTKSSPKSTFFCAF